MDREQIIESRWFKETVRLLGLEAVIVLLFWLLHRFAGFLQNLTFGDVLFVVGGIQLFVGGFGMMRGDTDLTGDRRQRGPAFSTQPKESETPEDTRPKLSLGLRLVICGFITILISVMIYLINKAGG